MHVTPEKTAINYQHLAPVIVRVSMSLVFLWFGLSQLIAPDSWTSWLPDIAFHLPLTPAILIMLNGLFEICAGTLLLVGFRTRLCAGILAIHLMGIIASVGYNDIGIRDAGLMLATVSIIFQGPDKFCIDTRLTQNKKV